MLRFGPCLADADVLRHPTSAADIKKREECSKELEPVSAEETAAKNKQEKEVKL